MCDNNKIKENYGYGYNYPLGPSPFDYYNLKMLPMPQQHYGAGFGVRTERDVMEWKNTMGNAPYPWGPNGDKFDYYRK